MMWMLRTLLSSVMEWGKESGFIATVTLYAHKSRARAVGSVPSHQKVAKDATLG